jgi:nucleotide-binding universal stress UspA family protein
VDFSSASLAALQFGASLAEEADAALTLVHVLEWPSDTEGADEFDPPEVRATLEHRARVRLEELISGEMRTWCRPTATIMHGKPYRAILHLAGTDGSDLIVMGVHGRNPLDLMFFGSTTNHVVRRAPCPVLTLKQ